MQFFHSGRKIAGVLKSIILASDYDPASRLPDSCKRAAVLEKTPGSFQNRGTGTVVDGKRKLLCLIFVL